ncbi:hypothetical protein PENSPDRAFT_641580 [Peniophora sp. CONT]|nr:hypothetical protein PENSPDRAFT_641580 [Peniophora sp. CONT]
MKGRRTVYKGTLDLAIMLLSLTSSMEAVAQTVEGVLWQLMGQSTTTASGSSEMPTGEILSTPQGSPLHALIIGINEYKSRRISDLRGAAADADAIDDYLRTELHVPVNQIVNLRNTQATRSAILRELRALRTRASIRPDDPILIFYAGHGATAPAPPGWATGSQKISLLVPHDCLVDDENGVHIQPIPDRTLGALLHELAEKTDGTGTAKGDNITVIFDCCHSGSGTREDDFKPSRLERGFELDQAEDLIPPTLDKDIWSKVPDDRAIAVAAGFAKSGSRSHVLLAACREVEKSHEENGRGEFTRALLDTLRSVATDKITYQDLMQRLPDIPDQIPQCEGRNTDRLLFNALAPSKGRVVYPVAMKDGQYIMDGGSIHGVTDEAQFSLYPGRDFSSSDTPLTTVVATAVNAFSTVLTFSDSSASPLSLPSACFAFQTSMGQAEALRLHIPLSKDLRPVMEALAKELQLQQEAGSPSILLGDEAQADLSVRARDGVIEYLIGDSLINIHGLNRLCQTTKAETRFIHPVLRAASHFFWHLHRSPKKNLLRSKVTVEVFRIEEDEDGELDEDLQSPLVTRGDNLLQAGVVNVVADHKTMYGVRVINNVSVPLHVWAFFFDCSDLSISEYYKPPVTGRGAEPNLPGKGELSMGYGAGGGRPYKYFLRPNQDLDVGFLKLFISTEQVDLSSIEQRSPFITTDPRAPEKEKMKPKPIWDTVPIAVVQRKPGSKQSNA